MKNIKPAQAAVGLIALGFVFIVVGWNGSARVDFPQGQIPYLLSAGAAGLAMIAVGCALMLFEAGRRMLAHLEQKLDALTDAVRAIAPGSNGASASAASSDTAVRKKTQSSANGLVVVGRSSFHRPDCRLVEGKESLDFASKDDAVARGLTPCRVCEPAHVASR